MIEHEIEFRNWLGRTLKENGINTIVNSCVKINKEYPIKSHFKINKGENLINLFEYTRQDERKKKKSSHKIEFVGNLYDINATYKKNLRKYLIFLNERDKKKIIKSDSTDTEIPTTELKFDGNDYLLELFNHNESELLSHFFNCIFFINPKIIKKIITESKDSPNVKVIRYKKNTQLFYKNNGKPKKFRHSKNRKSNIRIKSKENNLFIFENNEYKQVVLDSTGNNYITTLIDEEIGKKISCNNSDYKNYVISHIEANPNKPYKHFLTNIVIVPKFLDHYIDRKLTVDNKRINVILGYLVNKIYDLNGGYVVETETPSTNEKEFADKIISKLKFI